MCRRSPASRWASPPRAAPTSWPRCWPAAAPSVQHGAALRIVPLADDAELLAATKRLIANPPDITVATTGIGFRGWLEAAEGWGIGDELLAALGSGSLLARGPKARGAIRTCGLIEEWSPPSESSAEVLDHLLARGVDGARIAVQLHGEPLPDVVEALHRRRRRGRRGAGVPVGAARRPRAARPPHRRRPRLRHRRADVHQRPGRRQHARQGRRARPARPSWSRRCAGR